MNTWEHFIVAGAINSLQKRTVQMKWYQAVRTAEQVQTLRERMMSTLSYL